MLLHRYSTFVVVLTLCLLCENVHSIKKKIPDFIKLCSQTSSNEILQKCLRDNIDAVKPHLAAGIPEMRLRELDPLVLEKVVMEVPNFQIEFTNTTVRGASNFEVINNTINLDTVTFGMNINFPFVRMEGDYQVLGKLLVIQLESKGKFWLNTTNIDAYVDMRGKRREDNGKVYMDFNDKSKHNIQLNIKDKPLIYFYNLFENNEELTKTTNDVINDNVRDIIKELMPIVNEILGSFVFNTVQSVFNTFQMNDLFVT